jgi:hypothetical protein
MDPNKSMSRFATQFAFVAFWASWCLYMWHDPAHFGLKGEKLACRTNYDVTIVVFGRKVPVTDSRMRSAALALVSIGIVLAFGSLFISLDNLLSPVIGLFKRNNDTLQRSKAQIEEEENKSMCVTNLNQTRPNHKPSPRVYSQLLASDVIWDAGLPHRRHRTNDQLQ